MNPDVVEFIMSLINFCESVLSIPESIYTFGLETCPWVLEHIEMIKVEYNIDIFNSAIINTANNTPPAIRSAFVAFSIFSSYRF